MELHHPQVLYQLQVVEEEQVLLEVQLQVKQLLVQAEQV